MSIMKINQEYSCKKTGKTLFYFEKGNFIFEELRVRFC
jgi:hypothetical protein